LTPIGAPKDANIAQGCHVYNVALLGVRWHSWAFFAHWKGPPPLNPRWLALFVGRLRSSRRHDPKLLLGSIYGPPRQTGRSRLSPDLGRQPRSICQDVLEELLRLGAFRLLLGLTICRQDLVSRSGDPLALPHDG